MKQMIKFGDVVEKKAFLSDHPQILGYGILITGQNVKAGTVLGEIAASGKLTALDLSASDGSEVAHTIVMGAYDSTEEDLKVTTVLHAEAVDSGLTWPDAITDGDKVVAVKSLRSQGIYVK